MLDLAVEYKEHSGMGYTEFAAVSAHTAPRSSAHIEHAPLRSFTQVFEPYLVPGKGMDLFKAKHLCQKCCAHAPTRLLPQPAHRQHGVTA